MSGKRANGEGSISYDRRRKRYRAKITIGWEINEETGRSKQIVKTIGSNYKTKGEAARALSEYLDSPFNIEKQNITFSELYEKWFSECIKNKTSMAYRIKGAYKYCTMLYDIKFRNMTILDMKKCINEGTALIHRGKYKGEIRKASPQVKQTIKHIFNNMYMYAIEARIIDHNYARDFTLDKSVFEQQAKEHVEKKPFGSNEIEKLWKSIEFVPFADMILVGCYSGFRPGELIRLKISDVDINNGYIKGGIKKYYNEAKKVGSEYLFNDVTKKQGIGLSKDQYLSRFNKVMDTLKFSKQFTPHCTRHTFITKAKKAGMNEFILKIIVGHKITDLTENVYTHRDINELKKEMLKIKS